jgi:hypothetical protein
MNAERGEAAGMQGREERGYANVLTCGSKHVTAPNGGDRKKSLLGSLGVCRGDRPEIPPIFGCHVEETCSLLLLNKSFGPVSASAAGFEGGAFGALLLLVTCDKPPTLHWLLALKPRVLYWIRAVNSAATAVSNAACCSLRTALAAVLSPYTLRRRRPTFIALQPRGETAAT